jgi:hypothetical protein
MIIYFGLLESDIMIILFLILKKSLKNIICYDKMNYGEHR